MSAPAPIAVAGPLTIGNHAAYAQAMALLGDAKEVQLDFSGVQEADSAGVALLLALRRSAQVNGVKLSFINLPENILRLLELYQVEDLLD